MKQLIVFLICLAPALTFGQQVNLNEFKPTEDFDNVWVKKMSTDERASTFVIWVKKEVKLHKHEAHTENIYVLDGFATMTLGDQEIEIQPGDFITIPKGTPHAVVVTSRGPLKVISIQAPEFIGKDRILLESDQ